MTRPPLAHDADGVASVINDQGAALDALDRRTSRLSNQLTRHLEWCIREKGRVDRSLRNIAVGLLVTQFFVCVLAVVVAVVAS